MDLNEVVPKREERPERGQRRDNSSV